MAIKFSKIAMNWLENKRPLIKYSTYCSYQNIIVNYLNIYFDNFEYLDDKLILEFFNKLRNSLSPKFSKEIFLVFRMILKHSEINISLNQISLSLKEKRNKIDVLNKIEHKKLLRYVDNNFSFVNLGIFITLATGIRIGEICALTWEDIDLDNNIIHINKTIQRVYLATDRVTKIIIDKPKTQDSVRDIPITNLLRKKLKPLKKIVNQSYYVISNSSKPLEPRTYRNYFKVILKCAGIREVKFHCLRHTFATRCVEHSNDYKSLSAILGHSNITITLDLYVHPNDESKKKCIDKMVNSLCG